MKARNYDDIRKNLPLDERVRIRKASRPDPKKEVPEDKLLKSNESVRALLQAILDKPTVDYTELIRDMLIALKTKPEAPPPVEKGWSKITITPQGGNREGLAKEYIIEKVK